MKEAGLEINCPLDHSSLFTDEVAKKHPQPSDVKTDENHAETKPPNEAKMEAEEQHPAKMVPHLTRSVSRS